MKTLRELQRATEETISIWGFDTQREFFKDISTGRHGTRWVDIYNDIAKIDDDEIRSFANGCMAIDLNNLSDQDVKDLTTLVWASMMAAGIDF